MSNKGLDSLFIHYGIRKDDMATIEQICEKHEIDPDWLKEYLLKSYHEKKIKNEDLDEKALKKMMEKALQKIK
ncbi:DNA modification system-associated small protein [Aequorivita sp. KMM 9714]|uniref:DNA modification system-associated small protein n=1 Tax=Aequorivita sp. KMM 9714 TaxID=2707173 RepID=UPI0013EAA230|nr:DNA modification system-associated small protein [Aequorivita sp. KMM 9714]NGX84719.1 hypothetical protein [Aequorivita sp. KMM 9714]